MRRALSDPDSSQAQKQLPTFSTPREITRRPCIPFGCQNLCRPMPSNRVKPPSAPGRIFAQAGSPNYSFDKRVSFVYRFSMPWALRLSPSIIPDTRGIFFATPWYHISSCIRVDMPNCRGLIRFLTPPSDFGAPILLCDR